MTAIAALGGGLVQAWRRPRLVLGLFALNVLWAVAAAWPCYAQLRAVTGRRPFADALARGVDLAVLAEILQRHPAVATAASAGAVVALVGWAALSWFLTAGVIGALRVPPARGGLRVFAAAAAARGLAMARVQLVSLIPYAAALLGAAGLAALAGWIGSHAASPWVAVWAGVAGALPGAALCWWTATAVDLTRVRVALADEPRAARLLWGAIKEVSRRPWRFAVVQAGGIALGLAVSGLYLAFALRSPFASTVGLVALTLLRQLTVVLRTVVRVGVLGATLALAEEGGAADRAEGRDTAAAEATAPAAATGP